MICDGYLGVAENYNSRVFIGSIEDGNGIEVTARIQDGIIEDGDSDLWMQITIGVSSKTSLRYQGNAGIRSKDCFSEFTSTKQRDFQWLLCRQRFHIV